MENLALYWKQRSLLFCLVLNLMDCCSAHSDRASLLLISFDGFRHDYLDLVKQQGRQTPNFDILIANGVQAKSVRNVFVTDTLPNHYSLVTGMYEENHGIVGNEMYDDFYNEIFTNTPEQKKDPKWWNNGSDSWPGEPVWKTNERAGEMALFKRRSGVYFWPGNEAPLNHHHPSYYTLYNSSIPVNARVDALVQWFADDHKPINLGLLYYEEPDAIAHAEGPNSEKLREKVVEIDKVVGHLIDELNKNHLFEHMNIIITSDHGMVEIKGVVYLEDFVNLDLIDHYGRSPVLNIRPKGDVEEVYRNLSRADNLVVYKKEDIPKDIHYARNNRVQPLVVSAKEGYNLCVSRQGSCGGTKGNHGYNNSLPSMHPFFIAHGPAFKNGYISDTLNIVDIYPLMCHILDIEPAQHDGNLNSIQHILASKDDDVQTMVTFLIVVGFAATVAGICSVAACRSHRILWHKQRSMRVQGVSLSGVVYLNGGEKEGVMPLLSSDEEEIP